STAEAAATLAISSLIQPFGNILQQQIADWEGWQARCAERSPTMLDLPDPIREQAVISSIVLRAHLDKTYPGAMVASLSVPWGYAGNQRGGYQLVWPCDLVHRTVDRAGPLGGERRHQRLHAGDAHRGNGRRRGALADARSRMGIGACRFLERQYRGVAGGPRYRIGPAVRCARLLSAGSAALGPRRCRREPRDCADPQPPRQPHAAWARADQ